MSFLSDKKVKREINKIILFYDKNIEKIKFQFFVTIVIASYNIRHFSVLIIILHRPVGHVRLLITYLNERGIKYLNNILNNHKEQEP